MIKLDPILRAVHGLDEASFMAVMTYRQDYKTGNLDAHEVAMAVKDIRRLTGLGLKNAVDLLREVRD